MTCFVTKRETGESRIRLGKLPRFRVKVNHRINIDTSASALSMVIYSSVIPQGNQNVPLALLVAVCHEAIGKYAA